MIDAHTFLKALATVLCAAAVTTVLFHRLRLPVVLGYILAGMIVGPYIPIPLAADRPVVHTISELGVILLMFSIGLEFSLRKMVRVGPTAGLVMIIEVSFMLWLGYLTGRLLGFRTLESIFTGAIVSISSTMIIAKTFAEKPPDKAQAELVFGILVFEDLMAILLLAALTALSVGTLSAQTLLYTTARLGGFLLALVGIGLLVVPRLIRYIAALGSDETLLVACIGLCFSLALLAQYMGYSVALGAFIAGSLVAESGQGKSIEHLTQPLRDLFGAVFFVSVGMMIDPKLIAHYWMAGLVLTVVVVVGKIVGVSLGAFLTGHSIRASLQTAMTLAQIGEFSFIIASVGLSQKATREFLYPLAVAVSALTALLTPILMGASKSFAARVDRKLPHPIQTFAALYASWVERLRTETDDRPSVVRRLIKLILVDDFCLAGIAIGASLSADRLVALLMEYAHFSVKVAQVVGVLLALTLSVPFWVGLVLSTRRLGSELAARAIPPTPAGQVDLGAAPRRVLKVTLELLVLLIAGVPLLAITQPFLPSLSGVLGALVWASLLAILGVAFWRGASNLEGHVRAGAQAVVEVLAAQSAATPEDSADGEPAGHDDLQTLLGGLGAWTAERIADSDACVGKTLAQLNLRGLTGATVLAIKRQGAGISTPGAKDTLHGGDVLVLAGSAESIKNAALLLHGFSPEVVVQVT